MTTDESTQLDSIDRQSLATELGPITPTTLPTGFSAHTERNDQGGKQYWRCDHCGVESIRWTERVLRSEHEHRDGCDNPHVGADR